MCEDMGVSLSVDLLATRVPVDVRVSAPRTTPPSNSTAIRVVPVDSSSGSQDGQSTLNILVVEYGETSLTIATLLIFYTILNCRMTRCFQ